MSVANDQSALDTALKELEGGLEPEGGGINGPRFDTQQFGSAIVIKRQLDLSRRMVAAWTQARIDL